jgi:hypothetical protein
LTGAVPRRHPAQELPEPASQAAVREPAAPSARRRALVLAAASLAAWLAWNQLRTFRHPWGDLSNGNYTDHFSHMNAARALPRVGLDLWKKSAESLGRAPTDAEWRALPDDVHPGGTWKGGVFMLDGWPAEKPWVTSSAHQPRLYPPGDLVLVAPIALVYHYTALSLTEANRWLFALLLLYAHVAIFVLLEGALGERWRTRPLIPLVTAVAYGEIIFWTLQGFYDAAALVPLVLCARYLDERRALAAAVAYSVAAVIHFRAFFVAPWALYAAWLFVRERKWRGLGLRDAGGLLCGLVCGGAALATFALVAPALARQAVDNPVSLAAATRHPAALVAFAVAVVVAGAMLARASAWLDLAVLAWMTLMILCVREAHSWHIVILLAWLIAPVARARGGETVRAARLVVLACVQLAVMVN